MHVGHESLVDAGMGVIGVALTETDGEGAEVRLAVDSAITTISVTLCPEAELAEVLGEYARRAGVHTAVAV